MYDSVKEAGEIAKKHVKLTQIPMKHDLFPLPSYLYDSKSSLETFPTKIKLTTLFFLQEYIL